MQRYFVDDYNGTNFTIIGDDVHHIKNVMRMNTNDEIICVFEGRSYCSRIHSINNDKITCNIIKELEENTELPFKVILAYGLVKTSKFELVIQKAVELGVSEIIPLTMERSIVKIDKSKKEKKILRWQKISKEAAEQSHRTIIPLIHDVFTINDLSGFENSHIKMVASEESSKSGEHKRFKDGLKSINSGDTVILVVGPEGGISCSEIEKLEKMGYISVSLGSRILRSETAPIFALSAIVYEHELK